MRMSRRECIAVLSALAVTSGCSGGSAPSSTAAGSGPAPTPTPSPPPPSGNVTPAGAFTPEAFGAVGDGVANDTAAFAKMAEAVNAAGGGTVVLRATTYIVGQQTNDPNSSYAYTPAPIMEFDGCKNALTILGNGARLRCADGLRFGTFDRVTGLVTQHPLPFLGLAEVASPYRSMIAVQNCSGAVSIENIELDGNVAGLNIGGPFGDTGWQIPASGLRLLNNSGTERVSKVRTHHHAQDGLYIDGPVDRKTSSNIEDVVSEYNARQGCSLVGGCNYNFANCQFNHTGRAVIMSAPGAGFDVEAEVKTIRDLTFTGCEFSNNSGCGFVADSGDSEGATFSSCLFVGTTSWSAWPLKPRFRFSNCRFVGAMCNAFPDPDPARATQFSKCSFLDDPALSPTKQVFGPAQPVANLGGGDQNVLFDGCNFSLKHELVLPWSVHAIYNNCTMSQTSTTLGCPKGIYNGVDKIDGNVSLYGSKVVGQVTLNGTVIPPTDFVSLG